MFESSSKRANNQVFGWGADPIARDASKEILHVPASGLASCGKWLPLDFCQAGLTLTFEMASPGESWDTTGANGTNCVLSNVRMLGTVAQLDSTLHSAYASFILHESGKLQIPYRTWTSQLTALPQSPNWSVTVSRSFKRLNTILLTLFRADGHTGKLTNTFTAPGTPNACESWVSIGAQRWPDTPQKGAAEQFMRLCSAVGTLQSSVHALDINAAEYGDNRYAQAFDVEKCPQAAGTGIDVSSGAICTVFANNVANANHPTHAQIACFHDSILSLSDGGSQVHE